MTRPSGANLFIAAMAFAGPRCFVFAFLHWQSSDPLKFGCYLVVALLASSLKIKLPGINGTMSVNFLFILLGILELSFAGDAGDRSRRSTLVQCYWRSSKRLQPVQLVFNLSQLPFGARSRTGFISFTTTYVLHGPGPLALLVAAITHFCCNTLAMATIIRLTENKPILKVWSDMLPLVVPLLPGGSGDRRAWCTS